MNTTITKDQMLLKDNEVYFIGKYSKIENGIAVIDECNDVGTVINSEDSHNIEVKFHVGGSGLYCIEEECNEAGEKLFHITHSTAKLDGIIHLQREWFVKGEDITKLAINEAINNPNIDSIEQRDINMFKAGYNANKGEFTREQMEKAYSYLRGQSELQREELSFDEFINSLQPLSLPQSLTLNKDNDIVKIEW